MSVVQKNFQCMYSQIFRWNSSISRIELSACFLNIPSRRRFMSIEIIEKSRP